MRMRRSRVVWAGERCGFRVRAQSLGECFLLPRESFKAMGFRSVRVAFESLPIESRGEEGNKNLKL